MEKNKKRLIVFMPSMEGGGVEKNIILITNYLSKYIKKISLITYDKKFKSKFKKKVNFISSKKPKENVDKYYKYFVCCLMLIRELFKKDNCIVLSFQANIYCLIISKIFNFKIILRSNSSPSGWSKSIIKNLVFKFMFKRANKIIVNSLDFKKELDKKFKIRSVMIYNPLNKIEILKKSKKKVNLKFFEKKDLKLINIARFTDQKDHLTLLKSINNIKNKKNIKLLIIGYGSNKEKIINFIRDNELSKNVKVIGFQDNPYKYLNLSDVLILSSLYEGAPNVLIEALCLKKFVISSNCPTGPKEILKNGNHGFLFKIKDHNHLSQLILKYKLNKNKLNKKSIDGYKSLERFDYKKNCEKYLNIIKEFV